jgi:hypothetical protein
MIPPLLSKEKSSAAGVAPEITSMRALGWPLEEKTLECAIEADAVVTIAMRHRAHDVRYRPRGDTFHTSDRGSHSPYIKPCASLQTNHMHSVSQRLAS